MAFKIMFQMEPLAIILASLCLLLVGIAFAISYGLKK